MADADDVVWEAGLDKRYVVKVLRVAPYAGQLQLWEGTALLHEEPVDLSYDAVFGPDIDDVAHWQDMAIKFVDGREPK